MRFYIELIAVALATFLTAHVAVLVISRMSDAPSHFTVAAACFAGALLVLPREKKEEGK